MRVLSQAGEGSTSMKRKKELLIIFAIIFVNLIGFGIIIPLLPLYAVEFGATEWQVGLLFASYSVAQLIATPILGALSDRYGRRPILLVSLLGTVVSFVMMALANSLAMLFLARIVDGISGGNIPTARAYISDVTTREERAGAYGLIGAAFGLGFILGPVLAGLLANFGLAAPAWGAAVLAAIALVMTFFGLPESHTERSPIRIQLPWNDIPELLRRPVLGQWLVIDLVYWASAAVYQTTFALFAAQRFDFGVKEVGYVLGIVGTIGALVQGGAVRIIARRIGERRTLAYGLLLGGLSLAAAAFTYNAILFVAILVPAAVGQAMAQPALIALLSQSADPREQGRVQGASSALESLGRIVGPIWGNSLLGWLGGWAAYFSAALVFFIMGLFVLIRMPAQEGAPLSSHPS
nr:MFS transporter [Ardenticatena sp.]